MKRNVLFGLLSLCGVAASATPALAFEHHEGAGAPMATAAEWVDPRAGAYPYPAEAGFDRDRFDRDRFDRDRFDRDRFDRDRFERERLERLREERFERMRELSRRAARRSFHRGGRPDGDLR